MSNILIINGHQKEAFSKGRLNRTIVSTMKKCLSEKHHVKVTTVQRGYNPEAEQKKFLWADTIIYQFPVYWFGVPALLQQYMQDVYEYGIFYQFSDTGYGRGGMLKGRTYMLSTTWNAPLDSFGHDFWQKVKTPDAALVGMHQAQSFIGLKPLPSFSCHNVVKNPQIEEYLRALEKHLKVIFG